LKIINHSQGELFLASTDLIKFNLCRQNYHHHYCYFLLNSLEINLSLVEAESQRYW